MAAEMNLASLVTLLADSPTVPNRDAFFRSLLDSKVGTQVAVTDRQLPAGTWMASGTEGLGIPLTTGPDGSKMLLVYCDIPGMFVAHPAETFVELEGRALLEMARANGFGVIVCNGTDGKDSWAAVPARDVADILAGKYSRPSMVDNKCPKCQRDLPDPNSPECPFCGVIFSRFRGGR